MIEYDHSQMGPIQIYPSTALNSSYGKFGLFVLNDANLSFRVGKLITTVFIVRQHNDSLESDTSVRQHSLFGF